MLDTISERYKRILVYYMQNSSLAHKTWVTTFTLPFLLGRFYLEAATKRDEQIRIQRKTVKTTKKTENLSVQKKEQIQTF